MDPVYFPPHHHDLAGCHLAVGLLGPVDEAIHLLQRGAHGAAAVPVPRGHAQLLRPVVHLHNIHLNILHPPRSLHIKNFQFTCFNLRFNNPLECPFETIVLAKIKVSVRNEFIEPHFGIYLVPLVQFHDI